MVYFVNMEYDGKYSKCFMNMEFYFQRRKNSFQIRPFELDYLYKLNCPFHGRVSMERGRGERERKIVKRF